ncbi:hypothetical protein BDV11DRAFT_174721 [Aspergillus similis]
MSIPPKSTVLVIGGGPGGSYAASVLSREGIDTVLLEAEKFPRYHIGESMLPSLRHYLRFIDLDEDFVNHGFTKKVGAAFRMKPGNKEGWTNFLEGGPNNYAWNVIRSEADELLFRHAGKSGAKVFDGVKVTEIHFEPCTTTTTIGSSSDDIAIGRPVSASYTRTENNSTITGTIDFDYLVDASGRPGLLNTKYLKGNRRYSKALKNIAYWAYYQDAGRYGRGTNRENSPFFEALSDESGWAWLIPLHNGTTSVGIVRNQEIALSERKAFAGLEDYYDKALKVAPMLSEIFYQGSTTMAKRVTPVYSASDYSYSSTTYSLPYTRIIGDAGCFIDPFFSTGVHLALTGGLAAGATIAASIKGDVSEEAAASWHSARIRQGFARFLLVVLSAYKQMRNQEQDVLSDFWEDNFDRAFEIFRPVIQGTVEISNTITQAEVSETINFVAKALDPSRHNRLEENPDQRKEISPGNNGKDDEGMAEYLTALHMVDMVQETDRFTMGTEVVEGRVPRLERGALTLVLPEKNSIICMRCIYCVTGLDSCNCLVLPIWDHCTRVLMESMKAGGLSQWACSLVALTAQQL